MAEKRDVTARGISYPLQLRALREVAEDPMGFTWKRCGTEVAILLDIADAALSVYRGLTSPNDPMDVDERIERLGVALSEVTDV